MGMETKLEGAKDMRSGDPVAQRLAAGDPAAPRELVERHHAELYCYARALLHDTPAAEDAVQEALLAAAVQWPRAGVPDRPRSWLVHGATRPMADPC